MLAPAYLSLRVERSPGQTPSITPDPVEGKWYGMAGFPQDRVEVGFEIKRNEKGEIKVYLYQPVINFYGLELPGVMVRDGEKYVLSEYAMTLTLSDEKLEGTFLGLNTPISLRRTDRLPAEVPVPDLPKGPGPKWQTKLGAGAIYAPAVVHEGVAYVGTTGGIFHAVSLRDGSIVWTFAAGRPMYGEALATADSLFFVCDNGYLFKLERKTGKEVWRYDLGDARVSRILPHQSVYHFDFRGPRPLLADGVIYIGSGDGSFHAVNASTGQRVWRFEPSHETRGARVTGPADFVQSQSKIRAGAALDGPRVVFGSLDQYVYSLERQTGKKVWEKNTQGVIDSAPVIVGDKLIIGNRNGLLAALNPATAEVLWRMVFWGSSVESEPAPADGLFYIGSSDLRRVTLIDPKDARVLWRTDVYGWAWGRPIVTDKMLYIGVAGGTPYDMRHLGSLAALDRKTGKLVWRWPMPEWPGSYMNGFVASPAIEGQTLVIGGVDGTLYAFPVE
ncbi:MAG TPA: PQQ-binding-like beta-propeller repeat protein [Pyrinomonadaceae bacterium]|nr:PQQ-binding-like beta-propeller repeat protein [Pyrinomonadaceae bacterium]